MKIEFQNRARELLDLFCADPSADGGQVGQMVAELSRILMPPAYTNDWGELDAAVWNWNPHQNQKGIFYANPGRGQNSGGSWQRTLVTPDLAGFCRYIVEFCTDSRPVKNYAPNDGDPRGYGFGFLQHEARDRAIPVTPSIRLHDAAVRDPDPPSFAATPFVSPVTNQFAAIQWRVAEIRAPGRVAKDAGDELPPRYELKARWVSPEIAAASDVFRIPAGVCEANRTYRVRARYKDQTGRWSHWSAPVQFGKQ